MWISNKVTCECKVQKKRSFHIQISLCFVQIPVKTYFYEHLSKLLITQNTTQEETSDK